MPLGKCWNLGSLRVHLLAITNLDPVRKLKTSTGDMYVTTSCCLNMYYILQVAQSNVLTAHTQAPSCSIATQILKSPSGALIKDCLGV